MLKKGSKGSEVKALQSFLGIAADGDFGNITEQALKNWQQQNGLVADGIAGEKTLTKMGLLVDTAPVASGVLATETIATAVTQLGVEESPRGSNAGPVVEQYLKSVGLGKGNAWCMAFVYWCTQQAAAKTGIVNPLKKTAGVMAQWNERPALRKSVPQAGDVFIIDHGAGKGHTGFVEKILANGTFQTIEGNTNDEGSREGYEVCRRTRKTNSCKGFLRL